MDRIASWRTLDMTKLLVMKMPSSPSTARGARIGERRALFEERTENDARKTSPIGRCADRPVVLGALYAKLVQVQKFSAGGRWAARFLCKSGKSIAGRITGAQLLGG